MSGTGSAVDVNKGRFYSLDFSVMVLNHIEKISVQNYDHISKGNKGQYPSDSDVSCII